MLGAMNFNFTSKKFILGDMHKKNEHYSTSNKNSSKSNHNLKKNKKDFWKCLLGKGQLDDNKDLPHKLINDHINSDKVATAKTRNNFVVLL